MTITHEDGSLLTASSRQTGSDSPLEIPAEVQMDGGYVRSYWTEVCSLELLFSEYIQSLIPTAESFEPGKQVTSSDIDLVIGIIRRVREWAIQYLHVQIRTLAVDVDPFFIDRPMPEIYVVREGEFKPSAVMPIGDYVKRSSDRYHGITYDSLIEYIGEPWFKIGISSRPTDEGKHYLLLPDPVDLLCAAKQRVLFSIGSF